MNYKTLRYVSLIGIFMLLAILAGCTPSARSQSPTVQQPPMPLADGQIVLCVLGDKPVMRSGETGEWFGQEFSEGRVEIFENVVVITEPDGKKHSAPHEWFKTVTFK